MKVMIRGMAALILTLALGGCVVANALVEPYTELHFAADGNINPDDSGRSSPLVVRVYELSSKDAFKDAEFFELYDDATNVLEKDLLSSAEFIARPARGHVHDLRLHKDTKYLGIIGAFRDIENAEWKLTLAVDPRGYKSRSIRISSRSISRDKG